MIEIKSFHTFIENSGLIKNSIFCKEIVSQVMDYCKDHNEKKAKEFRNFRKEIRISGFRPGKVPDSRFIDEISKFRKNPGWLIELLLWLWGKHQNDLMPTVKNYLSDTDIEVIENIKECLCKENQIDAVKEIRNNLCKKHNELKKDEYWLAFCLECVAFYKEEGDYSEDDSTVSIIEEDENKDDNNTKDLINFWKGCLEKLSSFPIDSIEWQQLNKFTKAAEKIREELKKSEINENQMKWLEQKWNDFKNKYYQQIELFEIVPFNAICEQLLNDSGFKELKEKIKKLDDQLDEYIKLDDVDKERNGTLDERRQLRDNMIQVEDRIQDLNKELKTFIDVIQSDDSNEPKDDIGLNDENYDAKKMVDLKDSKIGKVTSDVETGPQIPSDSKSIIVSEEIIQIPKENELPKTQNICDEIEKVSVEPEELNVIQKSDEFKNSSKKIEVSIQVSESEYIAETSASNKLHDVIQDTQDPPISKLCEEAVMEDFNDLNFIDVSSSHLAKNLLKDPDRSCSSMIHALILKLLYEGKLSLALQLSRCRDILNPEEKFNLFPWLIECYILNQHVLTADGQIPNLLVERFFMFKESIFHPSDKDWNHLIRFIALGSCLRSALIAPLTGAADVIRKIRFKAGLEELYQLTQSVANFSMPLDLIAIKKIKDKAAWDIEIDTLKSEAKNWFSYAPQLTTCFLPATKVWRKWLERGDEVHSLLEPVTRNDAKYIEAVKSKINELSNKAIVAAKIEQTRYELIKIKRKSSKIVSKALNQFHKNLDSAISLAQQWVSLQTANPNTQMNYALKGANKLKDELLGRQDLVFKELATISESHCSFAIKAGCSLLHISLKDLYRLFDPQSPMPSISPDPTLLFNEVLIRTPMALLNEDWVPRTPYNSELFDALLDLITQGTKSLPIAFEEQTKVRNHLATQQILELMQTEGVDEQDLTEFHAQRQKNLDECREALKRESRETVKIIEGALAFGFLNESERNELIADINGIDDRLGQTLFFGEVHLKLHTMRNQLLEKRNKRVEETKARLLGLNLFADNPSQLRILNVLSDGDILTANEYIDMVERGERIPKTNVEKSYFTDFFIDRIQDIELYLQEDHRRDNEVIRKVNNRTDICGLDMRRASKDQAVEAAEMLKAWFSAKRSRYIEVEKLQTIFRGLGFSVVKCEVVKKGRRPVYHLETIPIKDRNLCAIPAYGSHANGHYRVFCVWDRPTEEDLINEIGETLGSSPVLVMHFGRVFLMRRRSFPRICRERRRTLLLLDDTLLLYLAAERESRVRAFFECTLPFTVTEPYTITAGLVPPEMFYGRRREREEIVRPTGSCFIYGGRQLGKTALLRDIVREFHLPSEGKHALWIDLKTEGIGLHRPINDIWETLINELKNLEVVPAKVPQHTGWNKISLYIQQWLENDGERRILFLLDEADRFLKSDADDKFSRVDQLKGLMDRTNRRFKVVFAGLHDVLRTTNQPNQALAHYGEPICIGPLLNNGEWREARALVEKPLAALGYQFESPDLVTRILSHTNYFPSLIQLYCHQLLKHLNNPHDVRFDPDTTPPCMITSFHVDDAYQSQELRKAIRDRFIWTLDLDPRYRLIAFAIANYCYENLNSAFEDWLEVETIREEVLNWWAKGFQQGSSSGDVKALLDEMVGLGVLRKKEDKDLYAFRSPNVVSMIGTEEEIQNELLKEKEAPLEYEAATFRAAMNDGNNVDPTWRSPITAKQEFILRGQGNGVCIIFGSQATGINHLSQFLKQTFGDEFFIEMAPNTERNIFQKELKELNKQTKEGTTLLVSIPPTCDWDRSWIEDANIRLKALLSKKTSVRIAFIADPKKAFAMIQDGFSSTKPASFRDLTTLQLTPWHDRALRQWLEDCNIPMDAEQRKMISTVTCNWPIILDEFRAEFKSDQYRWPDSLEKLEENILGSNVKIRELGLSMGLNNFEAMRVINSIGDMGEITADELSVILDDTPKISIESIISWAQKMNLIHAGETGGWILDPLVDRIRSKIME